jgi:guanine deaminase
VQKAFRASIFHCLDDPGEHASPSASEFFDDGLLVVEDGAVVGVGPAATLLPGLAETVLVEDFSGRIIMPGLIDCHVHYSQLDIIASYGEQLLDWLSRYAYPEEARFADADHADNGTRVCDRSPAFGRLHFYGSRRAQYAARRRQGTDGP